MKEREEKDLLQEISKLKTALKQKEKECISLQELRLKEKAVDNRSGEMLHHLVEAAAGKIGQDFFDKVVENLAEWLGTECVLIGRMSEAERIYAEPLYLDGKISHGFSYPLENTPCSVTSRKGFCAFPEDVIKLFPKDQILVDLNAQGYIGTALFNKEGVVNGVICAVSRNKLNVPSNAKDILKIIGARVSAEIERKRIEEVLLKSEAELKESNDTKSKFLSIIAHDLLSPLGTNRSFSQLLLNNLEKYEPEKIRKFLRIIDGNTQHLISLLHKLLGWARSQQGLMGVTLLPEGVKELVEESILHLQQTASRKDVQIVVNIDQDALVSADREMLSAIIRNLVSNAIKYSYRGGKILIGMQVHAPDPRFVEIFVKDEGQGVCVEELGMLFSPEVHSTTPGTENERGTGLGLMLCKEFAQKMDGDITVKSSKGKGSTFFVKLKSC
ncbi:MAG: HAMP domain-containing histidine kinase [Bacteroidales bacterium]|nr:HAMP domain-containing histidine kinase [Bacteroidales bacterium]